MTADDVDPAPTIGPARTVDRGPSLLAKPIRTVVVLTVFVLVVCVAWEAIKWLFGDPWRLTDILGTGVDYYHVPPFPLLQASDLELPHLWTIVGTLLDPFQRNSDTTLLGYLIEAAFYTWREAFIGFTLGAIIGVVLAVIFVHYATAERALLPYVIVSQTIPIVALAPILVVAFGRGITSVVIIATYLTFFPVTIAETRGLRSPDPRAIELMRSYAASRRTTLLKVRFPASVPYLFTALKVAAVASVVGAIIGEGPGGIQAGLGRAIVVYYQQYITAPEKMWATIFVAAIVGILFFVVIRVAEIVVLRGRHSMEA
jgi:NitT/TauT family transport system permease protein